MFKLSHLLLSPTNAEKHPLEIILTGFLYASLSLIISLWIFPDYSSLFMIFLTVISCLYIIQGVLIIEEKKEKNENSEAWLLKEHFKALVFLMSLFLGFLIAFTFWTIILPTDTVSTVFSIQADALKSIQSMTGKATSPGSFEIILTNNLRVLFLSLLLALFYGAGAVFILAWNASIMGFVIGNLTKHVLGYSSLPYIVLKYFLHGIPEMLAYFVAALAGSILFISIIRSDLKAGRIKRTFIDFFTLLIISIIILILAALIEVYISSNI